MRRGLAVVDAAATFGWATSTGQRKGVYRFASFDAMERHRVDCLVRAMADLAAERASQNSGELESHCAADPCGDLNE